MTNFIDTVNQYFFWLVNYEGRIYLLYDKVKQKYFISFMYLEKLNKYFEIILKN